MDDIQVAINEYMRMHPINVNQIKVNYRKKNRVKFADDNGKDSYILGVNLGKLYLKELMMK